MSSPSISYLISFHISFTSISHLYHFFQFHLIPIHISSSPHISSPVLISFSLHISSIILPSSDSFYSTLNIVLSIVFNLNIIDLIPTYHPSDPCPLFFLSSCCLSSKLLWNPLLHLPSLLLYYSSTPFTLFQM